MKADWLNLPTVAVPQAGVPKEVLESNPKFSLLVDALAALSPKQRTYVRALPGAHYVPAEALRQLQAAGMKGISQRTVYRWNTEPAVRRAIDVYRELAGEFAGIDALSVMLRVSAWADYCMEEIVIKDEDDKEVSKRRRDPANGLRALELLGKHTGALNKDEAGPQSRQLPAFIVGVQINTREPKDAIDVEVREVPNG